MTVVDLTLVPVPGRGPEDVLVDRDGWVLTGTEDGSVFRVRPDGGRIDEVGRTGGRPLGLEHLPDGRVLVCDAVHGLLALDPVSGRVEELTASVRGRRLRVCNNAAVHTSGDIWFTDSSQVHPLERYRADIAEDTRTGRLLRRATDGEVEVVLDGLAFANGVALAEDESFVAVAESGAHGVVRHWLRGDRAGTTDRLVDDLPGHPDNIARGSDGLIWIAVASGPLRTLRLVHRAPAPVRRLLARTPERLQPRLPRIARVVAVDDDGRVVHDLEADARRYHMVTGVREHDGRLWLGSLEHAAIACADLGTALGRLTRSDYAGSDRTDD
jgi:sugar lactone lactonase YvrE